MVARQAGPNAAPAPSTSWAPVTIDDVAAAANVSIRTVSRVLNNSPKVGAETRRLIEEQIERLQFCRNSRARGLAAGRSFLIGVVQDDQNAHIIDAFQRGIVEVCSAHGYELVVHPARYASPTLVEEVCGFARQSRVDGLLLPSPLSELSGLAAALRTMGLPTVAIAAVPIDGHSAMLISDERAAVAQVARHLVSLGHRRIAMITGPAEFKSASERIAGFCDALAADGIAMPPAYLAVGDYGFASGRRAAQKLLALPERPTAIFASNDHMAAAVLQVAAEIGVSVPADLSVFGFDDSDLAEMLTPPLSTVRRPVDAFARAAARRLLHMLDGSGAGTDDRVALTLILRGSTAPLPANLV